jgi:hypothetical protein
MWDGADPGDGPAATGSEAAPVLAERVLGRLTAQRLQVELRVTRDVWLSQHQGAAIRGAFFGVLRDRFCVRRDLPSCQPCTLHAICPISALVATVDDASPRGLDVPRPFTLEPPVGRQRTHYAAGETYRFGLTLFGRGLQLLPYVVVGLQDLGAEGIGRPGAGGAGSEGRLRLLARGTDDEPADRGAGDKGSVGRLRLARVEAWNPITRRRQPVYAAPSSLRSAGRHGAAAGSSVAGFVSSNDPSRDGRGDNSQSQSPRDDGPTPGRMGNGYRDNGSGPGRGDDGRGAGGGMVRLPAIPVTHRDVLARAERWRGQDRITLRLLTPLRLVAHHQPVRRLSFELLLRRLADRLELLARHYAPPDHGPPPALGPEGVAALGALAGAVQVVDDRTRWAEVFSHSARQGRTMPVSGLVGELTFGAEPARLALFLPWLVWGELAHAGKDATKGNGWYVLLER